MSTVTEYEPLPCHYDQPDRDEETRYCGTHAGWVFAEDECEGAIGSLHCNECVATGCHGEDNCECHDPANARHQEAFAS